MKKSLLFILTILLCTSVVFADTKDGLKSVLNRMYILENDLLSNNIDEDKILGDIKYIRSISISNTNDIAVKYKQEKNLEERTKLGNELIASILYDLALDHAEVYVKNKDTGSLSDFISKKSLADLIVNGLY